MTAPTATALLEMIRAAAGQPSSPSALVDAINATQDPDVFIALGELAHGEPEGIRVATAAALRDAGNPEALATLEPLLQDVSDLVRRRAVDAVEQLGAVDDLIPALSVLIAADADPAVRAGAVRSLGIVFSPQADAALAAGLADPDTEVRAAAKATCERFKRQV